MKAARIPRFGSASAITVDDVALPDPGLFIDIPKGDRSEMFASPKGDFFFKVETDTRIRFIPEGDRVTGLVYTFGEGEEPVRAKKIR